MADSEDLSKILLLKKQIAQHQDLKQERERLNKIRHALESELNILLKEIEKGHYEAPSLDAKKALAADCRAKLLNIDHSLDHLEEWTDEKFDTVKQDLVGLILSRYPDQHDIYHDLSRKEINACNMASALNNTDEHLRTILKSLKKIQTKREEVGRKGVFSYLIGANPNIMIAKNLQNIDHAAEQILAALPEGALEKKSLDIFLKTLKISLKELKQRCQERWGFKTVDKIFTPQIPIYEEFLGVLKKEKELMEIELKRIQTKFNHWIDKHSK